MAVHIFGIRHHGPGCARSLLAALAKLAPDIILVEGPPDAEEILPLMNAGGMQPPVAILIYPVERPQDAMFYPFAEFSPEWQALAYAHARKIPARFMDLPQRHRMPLEQKRREELLKEVQAEAAKSQEPAAAGTPADDAEPTLEEDPLGALALAAGYTDHELWWEHQIEQRQDPTGLFQGIMEAMTELRGAAGAEGAKRGTAQSKTSALATRPFEREREAFMRQTIREAIKEEFERIAVVCGAWHAPALATLGRASADNEVLKGLPKEKVAATWIPWTYLRLSYRSGYGAGVRSPGWYEHLWKSPQDAPVRWAALAARLMREEDLDASSASVIETVRLAEALAALRNLPLAGLAELNDATLSVLCNGDPTPLALIRTKLEIGTRLGAVPEETPTVPLQKDLEAQQKRLRLKATTEIKNLDLDLRNDTDRARSRLLHQLRLLKIDWGEPQAARGQTGTFHELWKLQWQVEFIVQLIEASIWGNTVEAAAAASVISQAEKATELPALTSLLDAAILGNLPAAIDRVLARLQELSAVSADVRHLADALPPLARVARYGDVRATKTEQILPVIRGFFERIAVGLAPACAALDDDAAAQMAESIAHVQESLDLLDNAEFRTEWQSVLRQLLDNDAVHGLLRGIACRALLEQGQIDDAELHRRARLELGHAAPPARATSWLQGLLRGSGLLLLHRDALWVALDAWLCDLSEELFTEILPLVRRAFASFEPPERRAMGEKVKKLPHVAAAATEKKVAPKTVTVDEERARLVLPVLAKILGAPLEE